MTIYETQNGIERADLISGNSLTGIGNRNGPCLGNCQPATDSLSTVDFDRGLALAPVTVALNDFSFVLRAAGSGTSLVGI
jgi:hypothetical protein